MANEIICIDTSVLISYYRSKQKHPSFFKELFVGYSLIAVSVITQFEIYVGSKDSSENKFWKNIFDDFKIISIDVNVITTAITIDKNLRKSGLALDFPDLLIGATAACHKLKLATLNENISQELKN